ncbi:hypothetical protein [uncultured Paludibaculum sp.]|uniref:hypothetical protein n=1 Tax=uncultured Paludibaculum sp. TaxID=1765020 RepID=UPI002AABFB96|nr:hypothetical protein [uncultured Paludibaculum sp.]
MTKVEVQYEFTAPFQEAWTEAIERLHGVYGMQMIQLSPQLDGLKIGYDASRLKLTDVENRLRHAGLPVRRVEA